MKSRRIYAYIIAGFLILVVATVLIRYLSGTSVETAEIILPSAAVTESTDTASDAQELRSDITPETVQAVVQALARSDAYSFAADVRTYAGTEYTEKTVCTWVNGPNTRIMVLTEDEIKNILLKDHDLTIWYGGSSSDRFQGTLADSGYNLTDLLQGIVTYEDILSVPVSAISEAGYVDYRGTACIRMVYTAGIFGYTYEVYVSAQDGILLGVYTLDGDTLIHSVEFNQFSADTPDSSYFQLPG